jgi:hypothetical protein
MTAGAHPHIEVGLNAVILAVTEEEPRILTVTRTEGGPDDGDDALPFGPLDPVRDRTLELGLRGWVREQTGLEVGYVEQLYTFGDKNRNPHEREGGPRILSIGYLTLVREGTASGRFRAWYQYFPWEDWREGRPPVLDKIERELVRWARAAGDAGETRHRRERIDIAFGLGGASWDGERVLDRYELLYEAGLVGETARDLAARGAEDGGGPGVRLGRAMRLDHRRILATAVSRLRGKIKYRPVVFELLPPTFTLFQLQRVVEALAGRRLHKQNFRRLVEKGGLVEGTGRLTTDTGGRPAELFSFRREVLRERPAPGVGLPGLPLGTHG